MKRTSDEFFSMGRANAAMAMDQVDFEYEGDFDAALMAYRQNVVDTAQEWRGNRYDKAAALLGFWGGISADKEFRGLSKVLPLVSTRRR